MKGWRYESARHSLASRGIRSNYHSVYNPSVGYHAIFKPSGLYEGDGYFILEQDGKSIGDADMVVDRNHISEMFDESTVPLRTALINVIRVNDPWKGRGFGRILAGMVEKHAKDRGMDRVWLIGVGNHSFAEKIGYRKIPHPILGYVYEKVL